MYLFGPGCAPTDLKLLHGNLLDLLIMKPNTKD